MLRNLAVIAALASGPAFASGIEITVEGEANGVIKIDLLEDVAPLHVERITTLAEQGAYDDVVFHRVIDGFMAQTGDVQFGKLGSDMRRAGTGGSSFPDLPSEFSDIQFDRGIVGMARSNDPNSANSQFFIVFLDSHFLDENYTVVGRVTEGLNVVDKIKRGHWRSGVITGKPDVMTSVVVTE